MNDKLKETFDLIHADDALKNNTKAFLARKTKGFTRPKRKFYPRMVAAAACLLLFLLGGRWLYFTPTAVISIDINPSIELDVNRFNRVISVKNYNDDGQELSSSLHVRFADYTSAVRQILDSKRITRLLSENEVMTIVVTGPDEKQSLKILSDVESCTGKQSNTYCYCAHSNDVEKAHEMELSYGKYRAYLKLQKLDSDITADDIKDMTMREILDLINSLSPDSESNYNNENGTQTNTPGGNCNGSGHGSKHKNRHRHRH